MNVQIEIDRVRNVKQHLFGRAEALRDRLAGLEVRARRLPLLQYGDWLHRSSALRNITAEICSGLVDAQLTDAYTLENLLDCYKKLFVSVDERIELLHGWLRAENM